MICALLRHYVLFFLWGKRERLMTTGGWGRSGCLILILHFPQTSHIISGSFAERDLQVRASNACWPPYTCSNPIWLEHVIAGAMQCVTPLIHMCDMTRICVTCLIHTCDMTHPNAWHDSFICVTWLHPLRRCCYESRNFLHPLPQLPSSFAPAKWLMYTYAMTHPYVWHDEFICMPWLNPLRKWSTDAATSYVLCPCDMTHSYVCRDSSIRVTWLIHMCDMT